MSNHAPALLPALYNSSPVPRPLAAMADDPSAVKLLTVLGVIGGFVVAAGGLVIGKMLGGPSGPTGATGPSTPIASTSASAAPAARAPETTTTTAAAPAAATVAAAGGAGGCPAGMALISAGKFLMGSDDPELKSAPAHEVTVDAFCMDVYEVTAGDYKTCVDKGNCKPPSSVPDYPKSPTTPAAEHTKTRTTLAELCTFEKGGLERNPINCVSWEPADAYCKAQKKRLPTEAEWEFAARGAENHKFPWGDDPGDQTFLNACGTECTNWLTAHDLKESPRFYEVDDGFFGTAPVGSFAKGKTRAGVHDLAGNVWEWTADWYGPYKADAAINPRGAAKGDRKTARGGAFNSGSSTWVSSAYRFAQLPAASAPGIGFRCVSSP